MVLMSTPAASEAPPADHIVGACPRCGTPLPASIVACPSCQLRLDWPLVAELSDLNRRHQALRDHRSEVQQAVKRDLFAIEHRRSEVLTALAALAAPNATATASVRPHVPADHRAGAQPGSANGLGTQALLLSLGVLCLAIAAAVFAAVGWGRLTEGGQAAFLLTATFVSGLGAMVLHRRGLRATGEAILGLTGLMVLVDTAMFGAALGAGSGDLRFWSGGLAALAALGAASWKWGGTAAAPAPIGGGLIAVIAAQLTLPVAVAAALGDRSTDGFDLTVWAPGTTQVSIAGVAVVVIVQALLCSLAARERRWSPSSPIAATAMLAASGLWLVAVSLSLALTEPTAQAAVLAGAAIAAALAASLPQFDQRAASIAAAGTAGAGLGAWAALAPGTPSLTVWLASGAALILVIAAGVPGRARWGAVTVGAATLVGTGWVLAAAASNAAHQLDVYVAGATVVVDGVVDFSWVDVVAVAGLAAAAVAAGPLLASDGSSSPISRRTWLARSAAGLVAAGGYLAFVLPPLIGTTQVAWATLLAAIAAAGVALVSWCRHDTATRMVGWGAAATAAAISLPLAHASIPLALFEWWALAAATVTLAVIAGSNDRANEAATLAGVASLVTVGAVSSTAALLGADTVWVTVAAALTSGALAVAATALQVVGDSGGSHDSNDPQPVVPLPRWLPAVAQPVVPLALAAQAVTIALAVAGSLDDGVAAAGTVTLLVGAVTWFALAALTKRSAPAVTGAILTQLAGWLLLGLADVSLVEAYTVPGALVLLAIGAERMRRTAEVSSWSALSAGLGFGLVPSSLVALSDGGMRTLTVIGIAALTVAIGAVLRLGAPVIIAAACVLGLSLVELSPLIGSLPRYVTFGAAGALLLLTGATFERRRAELAAAHRQLRALR